MDEFESNCSEFPKISQIMAVIITIVAILGLVFGLIFIKHEQRTYSSYINNMKATNNEIEDRISKQQITINEINLEIQRNENVESLIQQLKDNYPIVASKLEKQIINNENDTKIAYLTFDDGPYPSTPKFLDVLDKYDVRATFFYLQKDDPEVYEGKVELYDQCYKRIINSGHTLGNHTSTHIISTKGNGVYASVDNFMDSILENQKFIYDKYGYKTNLIRFPGGSNQAKGLKDDIVEKLNEKHMGYVDWNSETGDGRELVTPEQSVLNVLETTNDRDMLVVLMHDYSENTLEALPGIITGLREQGYILLPLFYNSEMVKK